MQNASTFNLLKNEWRLFCEKPPKGFEKYFKPGSKQSPPKNAKAETPKEAKDAKPKEQTGSGKPKTEPPPPSRGPSASGPARPYDQWSFGLFGGTGSRGSGGKPFGESEKDKWYIIGALGTVAFLGALAYFEMGYKEIGWKEFVHA